MNLAECLIVNECAYLALVDRDFGVIKAEIQCSEYWVGGEPGGWTSDSNKFFTNVDEAEMYYRKHYVEVYVFEDEADADEKCDELERLRVKR